MSGKKDASNIEFENEDGEGIPMELEVDQEEEEMFNPQEIDFGEVERLRDKVATFENVMS